MKISELIEALRDRKEKHGDVEVKITWESITRSIDNSKIYMSRFDCLLIDADGNHYKKNYALDPAEGE